MNKTEAAQRKEELLKKQNELHKELMECEQALSKPSPILEKIDWGTNVTMGLPFASGYEYNRLKVALITFIELRRMEGSEAPNDYVEQFYVGIEGGKVIADVTGEYESRMNYFSPMFNSYENAQKAIDTIGADRIRSMFNVLHGVNDE